MSYSEPNDFAGRAWSHPDFCVYDVKAQSWRLSMTYRFAERDPLTIEERGVSHHSLVTQPPCQPSV